MANTQKALLVTEIGKPVVLTTDRPIPQPGPNQVQLKVSVAGLNPHDQRGRDVGIPVGNDLPSVLTHDVVGKVTKLGEAVTRVAVGDRVVTLANLLASGSPQNGLQEYSVADLDALARIPDSISDDEAATLPTNTIAPLAGLFGKLKLPAPWSDVPSSQRDDTTVLIVGGGSSCGKFAVQLCKLAGIGRVVVVGGGEAELRGFGATHVVDRHGGEDVVLGRIRDIVGDDLVYALDAVNGPDGQLLALKALSSHREGALARLVMGPLDESKVEGKRAGFKVLNVYSAIGEDEVCGAFWERLPEYLETGAIKPLGYVVKEGLLADHVNEVLDAYRDGKKVVKTHIHL